jgi:hypothetical protein
MKCKIFFYYEKIDINQGDDDFRIADDRISIDVETFSHVDRIERFLIESFELLLDQDVDFRRILIKVIVQPMHEKDAEHVQEHYQLFAKYRGNFFFYDNKLIAP